MKARVYRKEGKREMKTETQF